MGPDLLEWLVAGEDLPALEDLFPPRPAWMADGLCREYPRTNFFPSRGEGTGAAKAVCGRCLVREECLAYALADPEGLEGVWGGTSPRERRDLLKPRRVA